MESKIHLLCLPGIDITQCTLYDKKYTYSTYYPLYNYVTYKSVCIMELILCIKKRLERMEKAKQIFKADVLKNEYIVIPINRR